MNEAVPSAHVACERFTNYPYWISLYIYKLCIVIEFPGINSVAQLSTVGYSFLVLNGCFLRNKEFLFVFLLLVVQLKDRSALPTLSF